MRPALLTPMRLLCGIAAFTVLCMFTVAVITDHLADTYLFRTTGAPSSRVHLVKEVTTAIKRAEDCRRAYLTTGDTSSLNAYRASCSELDTRMDFLVTEDHEFTNKLSRAEDLRTFVHAKLSKTVKALESKPAAKPPGTPPIPDPDLARIQKLLDSLAQDESRDISGELDTARARAIFHRNLVIALAAINILFLGGVAACAVQIRKLYALVTMCAWSKRVQYEEKWIPLEEYMSKRFGIRITHGISQEEYDKWVTEEMGEAALQEAESDAAPKAAA